MPPNRLWILCLCFVLIGHTGAPVQENPAQNTQRARAAIDRMIAALGGAAYLGLQSSESYGRHARFNHERSEGSAEFHRYWQWPDKERVEFTKQRDAAQLTVGDDMYEITSRGSRLIDPHEDYDSRVSLERRRHALEVVVRQWLKEPGLAMLHEGLALVENHSVERITLVRPNKDAVTLAIDTDSHLPVKKTFAILDLQGKREEIGEIYENWKMLQGVNTPFNTLITRNGELDRQYFLTKITYNAKLETSLFVAGAQLSPGPK